MDEIKEVKVKMLSDFNYLDDSGKKLELKKDQELSVPCEVAKSLFDQGLCEVEDKEVLKKFQEEQAK